MSKTHPYITQAKEVQTFLKGLVDDYYDKKPMMNIVSLIESGKIMTYWYSIENTIDEMEFLNKTRKVMKEG